MEVQGRTTKKPCIVIPIDNRIGTITDGYKNKDGEWVAGDVMLHGVAITLKEPKYGKSHFLKPAVSAEIFQQLTEEDQRNMPIIGNLRPWAVREQAPAPTMNDAPHSNGEDW